MASFKPSLINRKLFYLRHHGHKIVTSMPCADDRTTSSHQAGALIEVPVIEIAVDKSTGKCIPGSQCIFDFYRITRNMLSIDRIFLVDVAAVSSRLQN